MIKVLVTGASGFLGNYVIEELLKLQNVKIITTSRDFEKIKTKNWFKKVKYIPFDINIEIEKPYAFFEMPDKIIHLAWEGLPNYNSAFHFEKNLWSHYRFLKNMLDEGMIDVTITGTCFEYGYINGCLKEDINTNPATSYGIAKDALRRFIFALNEENKISIKWLRLFYLYGEGQNEKSLFSQLRQSLENNSDYFNMSKGDQIRDFMAVEKVAENIVKMSLSNASGVYNCCSGNPTSVISLVESIIADSGKKLKLNKGYYPYPSFEPFAFWGDNRKLTKVLGDE